MPGKESMKIPQPLEAVIAQMKQELRLDKNFDVIYRVLTIGNRKAAVYCIDGFTKDETLEKLLEFMLKQTGEQLPADAHEFSKLLLPYAEIGLEEEFDQAVLALLCGQSLLFIEGFSECLTIDCRTYPARSVSEPDKDKTLRGSRDGFVETLVFNTALIRRRIRDTRLTMEMLRAGRRSRTDICLCYLEDRVDIKLLGRIRTRIESLQVDALTMNQESLAECIYPYKWYNPFPKFKFTERPDTAASCVLEGNLIILVDNSPSAMVLPSSIFDIVEEADDYYFPPLTGTYLRLSRTVIALITYFITPLYLLFSIYPQWLPGWLQFAAIADEVNVPIIVQLLMLELAIDGLRLAAINTPTMLSTPLSITAGLALGEFSVRSGWFNAESMLYMAVIAVANFTQSSYELGYAVKFMRILNLILTAAFGLPGFLLGLGIFAAAVLTNRTIAGYPYLYPVIPFNWQKFQARFLWGRLPHTFAENKKNQ